MDDLKVLEKHLMAGDAIKLLPKYAEEGYEGLCRLLIKENPLTLEAEGHRSTTGELYDEALLRAVDSNSLSIG
jgi:hypothetical protein